ncbi:MAG TPA: hypothetical protein VMD75_06005 [Candidatus Binataceae bacterium]|nr:hypothetical protein [Candidatus Binataceae bacterium]
MIPPSRLVSSSLQAKKKRVLKPDITAPLSGWYPVETFSTEFMCHESLRDLSEPSNDREHFLKGHNSPGEREFLIQALRSGQCITTDDPRLKGTR